MIRYFILDKIIFIRNAGNEYGYRYVYTHKARV